MSGCLQLIADAKPAVSRFLRRSLFLSLCCAPVLASTCAALQANEFLRSTYLVDIRQGSKLSSLVNDVSYGGYELSGGQFVSFRKWYARQWIDMHIDLMTQVSENVGILWGVSTGESGEKYRIDPALRLGLIVQMQPTPRSNLSLSLVTTLGGRLRESTCTANYGEIGGVQTVNCRLAATALQPRLTLDYLFDLRPPDHSRISLRYLLRF